MWFLRRARRAGKNLITWFRWHFTAFDFWIALVEEPGNLCYICSQNPDTCEFWFVIVYTFLSVKIKYKVPFLVVRYMYIVKRNICEKKVRCSFMYAVRLDIKSWNCGKLQFVLICISFICGSFSLFSIFCFCHDYCF